MDPMTMTAVGSAIAGITGSALNYLGARRANEMNIAEARRQEGFQQRSLDRMYAEQKASYERSMADQERLSNTAYQRAIQDMRAAGMSPSLYNFSPASVPHAGMVTGGTVQGSRAHVENQIAPAVNSGLAMLRSISEIQSIQSQIDVAKSQVMRNIASTEQTQKETSWIDWSKYANFGRSIVSGISNIGSLAYFLGRATGRIP